MPDNEITGRETKFPLAGEFSQNDIFVGIGLRWLL